MGVRLIPCQMTMDLMGVKREDLMDGLEEPIGAATALRWLSGQETGVAYAGIAPPSEGLPESLPPGPKRIVVGTRDQLIDVDQLRAYAASHSIDLVLTPGDHFFHGRGKKIGDLVYEGLRPS